MNKLSRGTQYRVGSAHFNPFWASFRLKGDFETGWKIRYFFMDSINGKSLPERLVSDFFLKFRLNQNYKKINKVPP